MEVDFIRWMVRRDYPDVYRIESNSFEFPWSDDDFLEHLRQRNCIGMVAEYRHKIIGYMVYELHRSRLNIVRFAVHPDFRRQRVGWAMIERLRDKLIQQERHELLVEVRERNLDAQQFFRSQGFKAESILREHYEDTDEDCYVMQYKLPVESPLLPH
jgi:ribosomal-protein-alanine N-acetyltransferase